MTVWPVHSLLNFQRKYELGNNILNSVSLFVQHNKIKITPINALLSEYTLNVSRKVEIFHCIFLFRKCLPVPKGALQESWGGAFSKGRQQQDEGKCL